MFFRRIIIGLLFGCLSAVAIFYLIETDFFKTFELKTYDYRLKYRQKHKINPNIAMVCIDDKAIDTLGRWPWNRALHALLLNNLSKFPPKSVGFDILFSEKSDNDKQLAEQTNLLGDVVYAEYIRKEDKFLVRPVDELLAVSNTGLINTVPDLDGVIRRIPLIVNYGGKYYPSFALQVICSYLDVKYEDLDINPEKGIKIKGLSKPIPIDRYGNMLINYAGGQDAFQGYSFQQVLNWKDNDDKLKLFSNKLVIIGLMATGITDTGTIPIAVNEPLVMVQANVINSILNEDYLTGIGETKNLIIWLSLILLSVLINVSLRPFKASFATLILVIAFVLTNYYYFTRNITIGFSAPITAIILPYVFITVYRYGFEEREKRWIKKAFGYYLSKDVIKEIIKNPDTLKLGGELREATILFLDLKNFTGFCESHPPTDVVRILNEYFDWMTKIIMKNKGMLDKYMGDAIMAIFGAPGAMPAEEQTVCAINAAIEIVRKCKKQKGGILSASIGINTGHMVVGNMGSRDIFNYTAIGDEVNVAMRVQGLTSEYNTNIIITESVYKMVIGKYNVTFQGKVQVKGRNEAVSIYSVDDRPQTL